MAAPTTTALIVLSSPEFLISILSYLEARDILVRAMYVSRVWHEVVVTSPSIQQALFFQPAPSNAPRMLNQLLQYNFQPWFPCSPEKGLQTSFRGPEADDIKFLPWAHRAAEFTRFESSWRRMLVANGGVPITTLNVKTTTHAMFGDSHLRATLEYPDGIRMGVLWDIVKDWCAPGHSWFTFSWPEDVCKVEEVQIPTPVRQRLVSFWKKIFHSILNCVRRAEAIKSNSPTSSQSTLRDDMNRVSHIELNLLGVSQCVRGLPPILGREFQSEQVHIQYENDVQMD